MPNDQNIENRVIEFLRAYFLKNEITLDMDFSKNFGVDGDDARDLILEFSKEFDVSLQSYIPEEHFSSEASYIPVVSFFLARNWRKKRIPLRVRHLVDAARIGQLDTRRVSTE